jgi:hypothetical protein
MKPLFFLSLCISLFVNQLSGQVVIQSNGVLGFIYGIDSISGLPFIDYCMPGSPAAANGLNRGDKILTINGQNTVGMSLVDVSTAIKSNGTQDAELFIELVNGDKQLFTIPKKGFINISTGQLTYTIYFNSDYTVYTNSTEPCVWGIDCFNGFGYYVYSSSEAFMGQISNGERVEGLYYYTENNKPHYYLGTFKNNDYSGHGELLYYYEKTNQDYIYKGDFDNGMANGYGEIKDLNGELYYEGYFFHGFQSGYGKGLYAGKWEEGFWINNMYWRPWPEGVPHYNPATEFALYDMVLKKEEAAFDLEVEAAKKDLEVYFNTTSNSSSSSTQYNSTEQTNTIENYEFGSSEQLSNLRSLCEGLQNTSNSYYNYSDPASVSFDTYAVADIQYVSFNIPAGKKLQVVFFMESPEYDKIRIYPNTVAYNYEDTNGGEPILFVTDWLTAVSQTVEVKNTHTIDGHVLIKLVADPSQYYTKRTIYYISGVSK